MGIAMIGSVSQYAKSMKMTMDWKQKKSSGDYTKKADEKVSEWDRYRQQMEDIRKAAAEDKSSIYMKLSSGKKLTAEEMDYLREHDPEAYKTAKEIEAEQKRYEEQLKRCRTKEEAERLRMTYLSHKAAMAKEVANNPNIPKGQKMAILLKENAKMKAVREADEEFKRSSRYAALPTEEEKAREEEERMEELRGEPWQEKPAGETPKRAGESILGSTEERISESTGEEISKRAEGDFAERTLDNILENISEKEEPKKDKEKTSRRIHWVDVRQAVEVPKPDVEQISRKYSREAEFDSPWEKRTLKR